MGTLPPYYRSEIGAHLREPTRSLFKSYCNLSGAELDAHLHKIVSTHQELPVLTRPFFNAMLKSIPQKRDRSWKIRPYPCIGQWGFLEPGISHSDAYGAVLQRLKGGQTFLDIGCCMGQDLRRLAVDGAPTGNMYATDIMGEFWDVGYDLFQDRDSMKAQFFQADILDADSALTALRGKSDVVYVGSVLHLFGWDKQLEIARQLVRLSKAGTAIIGCQVGSGDAGEVPSKVGADPPFFHNAESWRKMWRIIEEDTGTRWTVQASVGSLELIGWEREDFAWMEPDRLLLQFSLLRI